MTQAYVIKTEKGNFDSALELAKPPTSTTPVQEDDILTAVKGKRVLMHIHGGLVPTSAAMAIAHRLSQTDGQKGVAYPAGRADVQLYLIWPADIMKQLEAIVTDSVFGKIVKAVKDWFDLPTGTGVRGFKGGKSPEDETSLNKYYRINLDPEIKKAERENTPLLKTVPDENNPSGATKKAVFIPLTIARIAVKATLAILSRRDTNPDPYEFEAMVREEVLNASSLGTVGKRIWAQMKATAVEHATGGFQTFLQEVYEKCDTLTLVGHSTGANIITALLPTLKTPAPDHKKLKVAFLAPAVTINTFRQEMTAFQAHVQPPLAIYAMTGENENADTTVPFYVGSLLQLVNFVFEKDPQHDHVLGLAFYAQQLLDQNPHLNAFVRLDTGHGCVSHGGFDDLEKVLDQI